MKNTRRKKIKLEREQVFVKVRGDAGVYDVWAIDWFNNRIQIYRALAYEWHDLNKVQVCVRPCASCHIFEGQHDSPDRVPNNCTYFLSHNNTCYHENNSNGDVI